MKKVKDTKGFGTIEAVILIAVFIGLAVIFREYVIGFIEMIFEAIFEDAKQVIGG
jgi:uncharacterized membrane protein YdfJ with MMPL/SSD domain